MYITKFVKSNWKTKETGKENYSSELEKMIPETKPIFGAVDSLQLSKEIEKTLNDFEKKNIELIKITPINSGEYSIRRDAGYGFGYTDGVIIIGKNNE